MCAIILNITRTFGSQGRLQRPLKPFEEATGRPDALSPAPPSDDAREFFHFAQAPNLLHCAASDMAERVMVRTVR
jgi:hypothetical protein